MLLTVQFVLFSSRIYLFIFNNNIISEMTEARKYFFKLRFLKEKANVIVNTKIEEQYPGKFGWYVMIIIVYI